MVSGSLKNVENPGWNTIALHGGQEPDPINGARAPPLYQTCAYNFEDAADGAGKFAWSKDGYVYTRMGNPTNTIFETRMAMLEGGVGAVATASGHAAQVCLTCLGLLSHHTYRSLPSSWPSPIAASQVTTLSAPAGSTAARTTSSECT